ncbi:MAG: response regulator [Burkholderiaceae bacterium]|nr:MAG: response regulator [Burkholderiaceae bacterium]
MIANTEYLFHVELFGFTERERMVFSSMFKLSEMRSRTYREWDGTTPPHPDCVMLDMDAQNARTRTDQEIALHAPYPIILIGGNCPKEMTPAAHLQRPVRWAELLLTLDNTFRSRLRVQPGDSVPAQGEALPAETSGLQNEMELHQVEQWYDRKQPMNFKTDPAVLVVDPDERMENYIKAKLGNQHYQVDYTNNGEQALDLIELNRYNVVIVEAELSDMEGYEICKHLKKRQDRRRTASIVLTTRTSPLERMRARMAGCDAFLSKPIDPEKLLYALEKFLPDWRKEEVPAKAGAV